MLKDIVAFTLINDLLTNLQHACALILPLATAPFRLHLFATKKSLQSEKSLL